MAWFYLFIAGLFEIAWAVGLKYSDGWTKLYPGIFTVITMIASFFFLSLSVKSLPIGTAYAVWTGIGTVGTVLYGVLFFDESREFLRIFFIFLIFAGIVGLKIFSTE